MKTGAIKTDERITPQAAIDSQWWKTFKDPKLDQLIQMAIAGSATKEGAGEHAPNGAELERDYWNYQMGFGASWELDFWGRQAWPPQ